MRSETGGPVLRLPFQANQPAKQNSRKYAYAHVPITQLFTPLAKHKTGGYRFRRNYDKDYHILNWMSTTYIM
jgi:hypothetical protein